MKALFFTLIILGAAFLGYDYFMAPAGTKVVFKSLNVVPPQPAQPTAPTPAPEEKPISPAPEKPAAPAPAPEAPKVAPAAAPAAPATERNGFTPPTFEPVEALTANWTKVPPSAFPRAVRLTKEVEFRMSAGASKMPAGGAAVALAFDNGNVTLAPTEASSARATVPLDSTDLKAILNAAYESWKPLRTDMLRKLYERKLAALKEQGVVTAPTGSLDAAGKPVRNPDGTYPILNASISSGQVTEVTGKNVISWGEPNPARIEGRDGWSVKVNYNATTIFGPMPVEAQALVVNGRVKGWYYTGSGEEVP